jgi:HEAT repeat protein
VPDDVPALLERFSSYDPITGPSGSAYKEWNSAAIELAGRGATEILEPLVSVLERGDSWADIDAMYAAAYALGELGDVRAVPALVRALRPESFVNRAIGDAVRKIGEPTAVAKLEAFEREEKARREAHAAKERARRAAMTPEQLAAERAETQTAIRRKFDGLRVRHGLPKRWN